MTSQRSSTLSMTSSLLSLGCALTSAFPASTMSWVPLLQMQEQSPRRVMRKPVSQLRPLLRPRQPLSSKHLLVLPLQLPPTFLHLLPGPGCPGQTAASWLLEFLFRATLQLYPGDRPLWLQPTRLNFKDHWTIFSVASSALFCVHRMAADRHASFPTHWKAHGQGERGHRRCQRCRYSKGLE